MSVLFKPPKPNVPPLILSAPGAPAPPKVNDAQVEAARRKALAAAAKTTGRSSTLITGGLGDISAAPVAQATLLGLGG